MKKHLEAAGNENISEPPRKKLGGEKMLGTMEIGLIVLAIVILFGGKKIPELARGLGTSFKEFRKAIK